MAYQQARLLRTGKFLGQEHHVANQVLLHLREIFCVLELCEIVIDLPPLAVGIDPVPFRQFFI